MPSTIIVLDKQSRPVVAFFYIKEVRTNRNRLTNEDVDLIQLTALCNANGKIDLHAWNSFSPQRRRMITTLSHMDRVQFIIPGIDGIYTGKIDEDDGYVRSLTLC